KAISRNMLVVAIGFVPLLLADLVPYITVGMFFFVIMFFSGVATLIILPALSKLMNKRLFITKQKIEKDAKMNVKLKTAVAVLLLAVLGAAGFVTQASAEAPDDPIEIMKKSHLAYYYGGDDGIADVTMKLIDKNGKERIRRFVMLRKDMEEGGEQRYYTFFKEPNDVRRMTFMVWKFQDKDDDRWIYIPSIDLVKRIAANDKKSSFVGSDFTYEDVSGRHWTEDTHTLKGEEMLDGSTAYVIESRPIDEKSADYSYKMSWIDKETYLPVKEEYYDKDGTLVKLFKAEKIEELDGILTITERSMTNLKKDHKTVVSFTNIDYNMGINESIFSERYLRKPPREYIK
ncbi:outer membrane lipoprotein-sorting protein, partial [candidate division KSB1 bacterium]